MTYIDSIFQIRFASIEYSLNSNNNLAQHKTTYVTEGGQPSILTQHMTKYYDLPSAVHIRTFNLFDHLKAGPDLGGMMGQRQKRSPQP